MSVTIDLPRDIEAQLERAWNGELSRAAKEALALESYRAGKLSIGQLAQMLGLAATEAEVFLRKRNVALLYDEDDFERDRRTLAMVLKR